MYLHINLNILNNVSMDGFLKDGYLLNDSSYHSVLLTILIKMQIIAHLFLKKVYYILLYSSITKFVLMNNHQ